jgi:predicted DNA-binding transcriptional regulator AlpA
MSNNLTGNNGCLAEESGIKKEGSFRVKELLFNKQIWRVSDVAKFLDCSIGHIYNLCSDEKIPKRKKGKFLFFVPNEIFEWILQGDC